MRNANQNTDVLSFTLPALASASIVDAYNQSGNLVSQPNAGPEVSISSVNANSGKSKFKRTPPPTFNGNRKDWAEFRAVWRKFGLAEYCNDEERAWAFKQSLKGKALDYVKAIYATQPANSYERMWAGLDKIYSDMSMSVQAACEDLRKLKVVREDDLRGLIVFINEVESCYSQLGEVRQLDSITLHQIDSMADLLPSQERKEWMKVYSNLSTDSKIHPFSSFMTFIENERDVAIRLAERTIRKYDTKHMSENKSKSTTFHTQSTSNKPNPKAQSSQSKSHSTQSQCAVHQKPGVTHKIAECNTFECLWKRDWSVCKLPNCVSHVLAHIYIVSVSLTLRAPRVVRAITTLSCDIHHEVNSPKANRNHQSPAIPPAAIVHLKVQCNL